MAIQNVQWASGDLITETKQDNMVADEVNTTDNIHSQYTNFLSPPFSEVNSRLDFNAAGGLNDVAFVRSTMPGIPSITTLFFPLVGFVPFPVQIATGTWMTLASVYFPKIQLTGLLINTISTCMFVRGIQGAGFTKAIGDLKFRTSIEYFDNAAASVAIIGQTEQATVVNNTWERYSETGINIAAIGSDEHIVVKFQTRMSTELTAAANDNVEAQVFSMRVDFLNRAL